MTCRDEKNMNYAKKFDVAVIGAGVFGSWTAWHLAKRGQRVALVEAYGPGNARASSAGESRIIRMGYGADEIYTRWSHRSLMMWKDLFAAVQQPLFHETRVLWMAKAGDARIRESREMMKRFQIEYEDYDLAALQRLFPQLNLDGVGEGLLEKHSGVLMARRAVAAVAADAIRQGVDYHLAQISEPTGKGNLRSVKTQSGEDIYAGQFVFACGPWLAKLFPEILGQRIFPSRQEVFFFGVPPGDPRFAAPALPTWMYQDEEYYGMPDIESRGLKVASDHHGPKVDPDTQSRLATAEAAEEAKKFVARRFPALKDAPIVETRVCQYENTSNGDFLIDRHPEMENVWFVGGGSGHGFKHGPAMGEYVAAQVLGAGKPEPRFSLATKETVQKRAVY